MGWGVHIHVPDCIGGMNTADNVGGGHTSHCTAVLLTMDDAINSAYVRVLR